MPYSSLERVVEENKAAYYTALSRSQTAMREDPSGFGEWLLFLLRALQAQKRSLEAKLELERSFAELSGAQRRILQVVDAHGRVPPPLLAGTLEIPLRTLRYHLNLLVEQRVIEAHGERRGRYYTRTGHRQEIRPQTLSPMGAVLAEVLERGGRIGRADLIALVKRNGYDARAVGSMHGRRLAHLRRDPATGDSMLTIRGREIAQQHLFVSRLEHTSRRAEA